MPNTYVHVHFLNAQDLPASGRYGMGRPCVPTVPSRVCAPSLHLPPLLLFPADAAGLIGWRLHHPLYCTSKLKVRTTHRVIGTSSLNLTRFLNLIVVTSSTVPVRTYITLFIYVQLFNIAV